MRDSANNDMAPTGIACTPIECAGCNADRQIEYAHALFDRHGRREGLETSVEQDRMQLVWQCGCGACRVNNDLGECLRLTAPCFTDTVEVTAELYPKRGEASIQLRHVDRRCTTLPGQTQPT